MFYTDNEKASKDILAGVISNPTAKSINKIYTELLCDPEFVNRIRFIATEADLTECINCGKPVRMMTRRGITKSCSLQCDRELGIGKYLNE